jgi:sugar phosphate isomerase/epimerase
MSAVHPRIAVSTITTFHWDLPRSLDLFAQLGVGSAGILYGKAKDDPAGAIAMLEATGVGCSSVTADSNGQDLMAPADGSGSPIVSILKPSIDFAAALGGKPCYFVAGTTPPRMPTDEAFDRLVAVMPEAMAYARQQGVPLAIEHNNAALRDVGYINTLRDCIEFSQATGCGVCLEIQNCWIERHLPELFREHVGRFTVVQLSDYRIGETTRMNRRVLGDGSIPLEWLLGLLLDAGYPGMFEIETVGPAIDEEGYESAIRRSLDWLNERFVKWGV